MFLGKSGRTVVFALVTVLMLAAVSPALARGGYQFEAQDGSAVLSNVRLDTWYEDTTFKAKLSFTPSNNEIEVLQKNYSHVDFEFTFMGLTTPSENLEYDTNASSFAKYIDARVDYGSTPTVRMVGFVLAQWNPHGNERQIVMTVEIKGLSADGDVPQVGVQMMETTYWPDDGVCATMSDLRDNSGHELCAKYGPRFTLTDGNGDTQF